MVAFSLTTSKSPVLASAGLSCVIRVVQVFCCSVGLFSRFLQLWGWNHMSKPYILWVRVREARGLELSSCLKRRGL